MARKLHELSDEEVSALGPDQLAELIAAEAEDTGAASGEGEGGDNNNDEVVNPVLDAEDSAAVNVNAEANDDDEDAGEVDAGKAKDTSDSVEAGKSVENKNAEDAAKDDKEVDPKAAAKVDDKAAPKQVDAVEAIAQLDALYAPFKANGREIKVASVEEARQLMQMGANYNKKMQAMKPHLSTLRMLENAKVGEAELSYLIDLHKRDPAAINKLVKESGIDPLDLSAEKAAEYTPGNHKPSDAEVELEEVLTELEGSEGLPKTIEIVTTQWDAKSKGVVAQNPGLLRLINSHVEQGIYELVATEVERRKTFGQLTGLSDFDAYRQVGDEMNASNKFAHLTGSSLKGQQAKPAAPVIEAPNPKKADDDKRKEQKRGAAPAKAVTPATKNPDFNPLSMPDEEFAKLSLNT